MLRFITRMNVGGPSLHVAILTSRLDPERFETLLISGREGLAEGSMFETGRIASTITPTYLSALRRPISPPADVRALAGAIGIARAFRPHIIHTHMAKAGFVGRIAGALTGTPAIIHTYHGSVFHDYFGEKESAFYLAIERGLARLTTRIVAISERQRAELIDLKVAPAGKIMHIPLGLDLDRFLATHDRGLARTVLSIPPDAKCVALVARLVPIKDVATFLRAIARLRESMPDVVALVVGDGEDRAALERFAGELGIASACRFLGWRGDVETVYVAADVVALTSLNEGMPVSIIEAMAAGRAVVATAVGGVPDVVILGTGVLVPPRDVDRLAGELHALLRDDARRAELGKRARAAAYPRFGAERLVSDIERLYKHLLDIRPDEREFSRI